MGVRYKGTLEALLWGALEKKERRVARPGSSRPSQSLYKYIVRLSYPQGALVLFEASASSPTCSAPWMPAILFPPSISKASSVLETIRLHALLNSYVPVAECKVQHSNLKPSCCSPTQCSSLTIHNTPGPML
jgi:hypothetical protein